MKKLLVVAIAILGLTGGIFLRYGLVKDKQVMVVSANSYIGTNNEISINNIKPKRVKYKDFMKYGFVLWEDNSKIIGMVCKANKYDGDEIRYRNLALTYLPEDKINLRELNKFKQ